jgi:hypothetical protein
VEGITSHAAAIHAVWTSQRRFRDRNGAPRSSPGTRAIASPRSTSWCATSPPITAPRRCWMSSSAWSWWTWIPKGTWHCAKAFPAGRSFADKLIPLAENLEDHAHASVSNVLGHQPPFLERSVFSDELSEESAAKLHELVRQRWKEIHDELVANAIELEKKDKADGKAVRERIRMGMYFYSQTKERK